MREKNIYHEPYASDNAEFDVHQTDPMRLKKDKLKSEILDDFHVHKPDPINGIQDSSDHYMKGKKLENSKKRR